MFRRFFFLTSIILVFSFCAALKAGPIDDPNYNLGFEFMYDVNDDIVLNDCHYGLDSIPSWVQGGIGAWAGVDVNCSSEGPGPDCGDCKAWLVFTEGWSHCYISTDATVYQLFDPNYDSNVILTAGRQYTVTFDAMAGDYETNPVYMDVSIFYVDDPNFPDSNRHVLASRTVELIGYTDANGLSDWQYDEVLKFVAEAGGSYLGLPFGVEFENIGPAGYLWVDNVRLEWAYATYAYGPSPADGDIDVSRDVVLNWKASSYAQSVDGHEVYFGTDYVSVRDATTPSDTLNFDVNYYDPCSGQLNLGQVYYWRVDEVNDAYTAGWTPGDEPPVGPWKGDIWSFEVTGYAMNPSPANGEVDIPSFNLTLSWDTATSATSYDVYFGADYNSVRDANDSGSPGPTEIYRSNQSGPNYVVPESLTTGLDVAGIYYWRIDPVGGADLTGHIWSFTIGEFLIVDDMESYVIMVNNIYSTWVDGGGASVDLIYNDPNHMRDPDSQAMELRYNNTKSGNSCRSSSANASPASLAIGSNWTLGGVKSITLFWLGDPGNVIPSQGPNPDYDAVRLWVELEDTSAQTHLVKYGDVNDIQVAEWHQWDISLEDYNSAGVNLLSLARVTIGIGGTTETGQGVASVGTIWIDDIRLYPPRCIPELAGIGDFTEDCKVNSYDLGIMATDWLLTDGDNPTGNRPATLTGFPDATSHWITGYIGSGAIEVNEGYNIDVTDPRLNGLSSMSITAWVKQTIVNNWVGIVSSREEVGCGDDATEIGIYGSQYGGPGAGALGYDWSCGDEEWEHDAGLDVPSDGTWTFVAISVDPTGGTLYMRPASGALQTGARNPDAHDIQQNFSEGFAIGNDAKSTPAYLIGAIDDVRIYTYALDFNDVNDLAYQTADPNPWPVYRYEFDEATGLTAADTGTPTIVYGPVSSVANLTDPEPKLERAVNFADYAMVADNWLEEFLWPF